MFRPTRGWVRVWFSKFPSIGQTDPSERLDSRSLIFFTHGCAIASPYGCPPATGTSTGPGIIERTKNLLGVCTVPIHHLQKPRLSPQIACPQLCRIKWGGKIQILYSISVAPSVSLKPGPLLLPGDSMNFIRKPSKPVVQTLLLQLARYGPQPS